MTTIRQVTELTLERYRLGELSEAESKALRDRVEADSGLRARLIELERSDADLLRAHPSQIFVAAVKARARTAPGSSRKAALLLVPASGVAVALIALSLARVATPPPGPGPEWTAASGAGIRALKGDGPALIVFAKRGDDIVEQLLPGATSRLGDVIQIAYQGGAGSYGVILSVDGRGRVTRRFPLTGQGAAELRKAGATTLDVAYQLDDPPRAERFYFVTADRPFAVEQAMVAARVPGLDPLVADRLPLSASFGQASFLLRRE